MLSDPRKDTQAQGFRQMNVDSEGRQRHADAKKSPAITAELIKTELNDVGDAKLAALLATQATVEEFEEALAWASGESDVMGELEKRLGGAAALVYEILTSEDRFPDEDS